MLAGIMEAWKRYRRRLRLRAHARLLVKLGALEPRVYRYLEALETKVEDQERELRRLRLEELGERLADIDLEIDIDAWRRLKGVDPQVFG